MISKSFPDSEIITALNGETGIKLAEREDPVVILLDVVMPGMDGFEVCRKLKSNPITGDIPVVFITAIKGDKEARIRALEVGAEAFLSKPIDEPELVAQIRAMQKIKDGVIRQRDEKAHLAKMIYEKTFELEHTHVATLNLMEDLRAENEARKKNEAELLESENRYRNLIMNSPDAIFINHNDKVALVNLACMKLFGATSEEQMIGKSQYEFTHPDYHELVKERVYTQRVLGKSVPVVEEKIIRLDGTIVDVDVIAAPFEHKGSIDIHVIMRDITARKAAEQQMRLQAVALNAAANAITITDPDGNFEWVNPAYSAVDRLYPGRINW